MKKNIVYIALLLFSSITMPVQASDACEVVLCMYGKVTGGNGGGSCNSPQKAFFSINAFKNGIFQPWKTADLRKALLQGCPTANPSDIATIINKFGTIRG